MSERNEHSGPDISGYVLGELSTDQRREFEQAMRGNPALAREAGELERLVARMESVDEQAWNLPEPPPLRLAPDALVDEARPGAGSAARTSERRGEGLFSRLFGGSFSMQPALAGVLVAMVFAGGLGAGLWVADGSGDGAGDGGIVTGNEVALQTVGDLDPAATGDAQLERAGKQIRIRVNGLAANSANDFYEAWMMDQKNGLVSIGAFKVGRDGTAEIDVPVPVDVDSFPVIDISLEQADGAPAHSGKSVLRGDIS